jgi:hypothetical protein
MQELVKNEKIEEYWKEATVELLPDEEFTYVVQNKNTNCIFIRNYNNTDVRAGVKPCSPEVTIPKNRVGVLSRPFPLRYAYLRANKPTPVDIIETVSPNPVDNFVQQEVTKNIHVETTAIKTTDINIDANKNIGVNVQNTVLKVCQMEALRPISTFVYVLNSPATCVLDTGIYGRPIINIYTETVNPAAVFNVDVSNDNTKFFNRTSLTGTSFIAFNDNAFRYIRVSTTTAADNYIYISGVR